jgi:hypothetical protein
VEGGGVKGKVWVQARQVRGRGQWRQWESSRGDTHRGTRSRLHTNKERRGEVGERSGEGGEKGL